ncbi:allophanate hydrolase [Burkholderia catarinensis]|uniref:allophanate hydrolase n=1 Tax=Burkholderia catarinensis TaxID=1108140 RepID=UPI000920BC2C|nr:allophanate hydrolase [Burkholderia catarinensis]KAG8152290.1 allophanate hydrolase [Burkholderia catarinensis]
MRGWTISDWLAAYRDGAKPADLLGDLLATLQADDLAWISRATPAILHRYLQALESRLQAAGGDIERLPLYGVPFAAKDNIDVGGFDTTAGCPAFAYSPDVNAVVVERLMAAGAIPIGKTNLDQFATGLVGVRSPYGIPHNAFDPEYISGGSSSGSASVVARGIVPFSLGTDTAGSGRVPAGLNNVVGLKPTRGAFSNTGVVPACRTLDCVSVFATTTEDAVHVYDVAAALDPKDGLSRAMPGNAQTWRLPDAPRFGIPSEPEFFGDALAEQAFRTAIADLEARGATCVPIDFSVFDRVTALLYHGPWVAERYAAIRGFAQDHEAKIHPVVRDVIFKAREFSAADAFDGIYQLAYLKREADAVLSQFDALVVPTAPTHYKIAELLADPIRLNSNLGKYTNFVNLLDWSAVAVPANLREDGLPFGITLIGDAWCERALASFAGYWHQATGLPRGATDLPLPAGSASFGVAEPAHGTIRVAVVGAHLRGMPLNHELTSRHAHFVEATSTSGDYRLYALANTTPPKPGLALSQSGAPIKVELWDLPITEFGSFVAGIPSPLGIGTLTLADGLQVKGFICEPHALTDARDITEFGGWASYLASQSAAQVPSRS